MRINSLLLIVALVCLHLNMFANPSSAFLLPFSVDISTGIDVNNSNTVLNAGDQDANWMVAAAPANAPLPVVIDGPSWVITPNNAWNTYANSAWVSAINDATNAQNNPTGTPYTFRRCFCTFEPGDVTLNFSVMADDWVEEIRLGNTILANPPNPNTTGVSQFTFNGQTQIQTTVNVPAGQHCLEIDVRNLGAVVMGLNVSGTITGGNILHSSCCEPINYICGFKFEDENGNGNWDGNEDGLDNWTIILDDPSTGISYTTQTNSTGFYCFIGVSPGNYTVSEQNQPGWVQTFPTPQTYSVNIPSNSIANFVLPDITFGNQQGTNISVSKDIVYLKPDCCENVIYEIEVCNTGELDAHNVLLEDLLPDCLEYDDDIFLGSNCTNCTYDELTGEINIPFIEAGDCIVLRLSVLTDFEEECENCVSLVSLDEIDTDPSDDSDCVSFDENCDFDVEFSLVGYSDINGNTYYSLYTNVIGGSGNYTYQWNTGATSYYIDGLCSGKKIQTNYSVIVTDIGVLPHCSEIVYFEFDPSLCGKGGIKEDGEFEEAPSEFEGPNKRAYDEVTGHYWNLYPTITSDSFITADYQFKDAQEIQLTIYNAMGQALKTESLSPDNHNTQIDISDLSSGLYFVNVIIDNEQKYNSKFIVK